MNCTCGEKLEIRGYNKAGLFVDCPSMKHTILGYLAVCLCGKKYLTKGMIEYKREGIYKEDNQSFIL